VDGGMSRVLGGLTVEPGGPPARERRTEHAIFIELFSRNRNRDGYFWNVYPLVVGGEIGSIQLMFLVAATETSHKFRRRGLMTELTKSDERPRFVQLFLLFLRSFVSLSVTPLHSNAVGAVKLPGLRLGDALDIHFALGYAAIRPRVLSRQTGLSTITALTSP
jgi:hypothetical protein